MKSIVTILIIITVVLLVLFLTTVHVIRLNAPENTQDQINPSIGRPTVSVTGNLQMNNPRFIAI